MTTTRRLVALGSVAILATTVLAACSSDSSSESSSPAAESSMTSETPEPTDTTIVGGDPSTWSPVEVTTDMNDSRVRIVVGQFVLFTDLPEGTKKKPITLTAFNDGVVELSQPTDTTNAGFQAIGEGKTSVTVWQGKPDAKGSKVIMKIRVTVKPYDPSAASPAASS
jgi:ABC-type Fe3+-hydroxamate transport system substrate-binding protein